MKVYRGHQSSVVVPCYNEAQRLNVDAFRDFAVAKPELAFVFVDDGSRDDTLVILNRLRDSNPDQFDVLALEQNSGKAEAVRHGMLRAADSGCDLIGFMDADLASPLDEVPRLLDVFERHSHIQVAIGSRRCLLGHDIERRPLRSWLGRRFASVASSVLRIPIQDTQCGLKMFRNTPGMVALFREPFQSRWIFDVEIFARLVSTQGVDATKHQVYEMPLESWREVPGSKLKSGDFFKAIGELIAIRQTYLRRVSDGPVLVPFPSQSDGNREEGSTRKVA